MGSEMCIRDRGQCLAGSSWLFVGTWQARRARALILTGSPSDRLCNASRCMNAYATPQAYPGSVAVSSGFLDALLQSSRARGEASAQKIGFVNCATTIKIGGPGTPCMECPTVADGRGTHSSMKEWMQAAHGAPPTRA